MLKSNLSRKTWLAWAMLGAGLLITVFASLQVKQTIEEHAVRQFAFVCDQITLKIEERLDNYAMILRGGAALFAASNSVERDEWRSYVEALRADENFPGVQGIGFAQVIPADRLIAHIARIRSEGFPEYTVKPAGQRPIYTSIIYLEPFSGRNLRAFGFDMFSEPVRRAAMKQARDNDKAALSGKVRLLQETDAKAQAGALMYVPVYHNGMPRDTVGQKRAALIGWVYSPYRMNDLMRSILKGWEKQDVNTVVDIYDGHEATPAALLFDSKADSPPDLHSLFYQQRTIDFNGHQWLLIFDHPPIPSAAGYLNAWLVLGYGFLLSGLLFGLMLSLYHTQANAVRIAEGLTKEIRHKQKLLKESEFRWKFAIEGSGDGLWDWNITDGTVFFSKVWKKMLGFTEDEIGDRMEELRKRIHPEDIVNVFATIQNYLDGKTPNYVNEYRIRCKDGSYKWALDHGMVVSRGKDGKPLRMIGTHRDITKRKQAEEELRITTLKYQTLFDSSQDALMILMAPSWKFTEANSATVQLFGASSLEEFTVFGPWDISPERQPDGCPSNEKAQAMIAIAMREGSYFFEWEHRRLDGRPFPADVLLTRIEIGEKQFLQATVRDISERKQAEEKIRKLNEELEIKVQERTRQLLDMQEKLVRKEKLAMLGQVAGSVGHELRNPLGVMSNAVYFLQTILSDADEDILEYLGIIKDEIETSGRIVSDLLDSVRTRPPYPETVGFAQLIQQTLNKCTIPQFIKVKLDIPPLLPPLRVDTLQIHQVFRNLISNGVEAMPEGGTLEIRAMANEPAKNVTISVHDTGTGITPEQLGKLFQPLFTTKARGIGLGLMVVKNLTEANGGVVEVESEPGKGSIFTVALPTQPRD